jgi:hypothetical protein
MVGQTEGIPPIWSAPFPFLGNVADSPIQGERRWKSGLIVTFTAVVARIGTRLLKPLYWGRV